jgi:hypothetical protein
MGRNYQKEIEDGKRIFKMLDGFGRPGREVETTEWELDSYVNYCLFPISIVIEKMAQAEDPDSEIAQYADVLDRLYDAARVQLTKMEKAITESLGKTRIVTTNEDCRGGFLQQDFLDVYMKEAVSKK